MKPNIFPNYSPYQGILTSRHIKTGYPIFVTANVLTKGIQEMLCTIIERSDGRIYANAEDGNMYFGDDFHMRIEEAKVDAEKRRLEKVESICKRIVSLEKEVLKLEILKFK